MEATKELVGELMLDLERAPAKKNYFKEKSMYLTSIST
jgi:hypothetical protein